MTGRRRYPREAIGPCLEETLEGIGPDRFTIEPAERRRFAIQFHRVAVNGGFVLEATIPASHPERRVLLAHGWDAPVGRAAPYYHRMFRSAAEALEGVLNALSAVYGTVGDEKGWRILARVQLGDSPWAGGRWSGDESEVAWLATSPPSVDPSRPVAALIGAATGLVCAWAVLQSSVSQGGWMVGALPTLAIVLGSSSWGILISLSGAPRLIAQRTAYMLGDGLIIRVVLAVSLSSLAAIAWGTGVVLLFGTRPPGA